MRESILVLALSVSFAVTGYSVLKTMEADAGSRLLMTSLAIAFLVLLVGLGWISSTDSDAGIVSVLFRFLPNIIDWGSDSTLRTLSLAVALLAAAGLSYWIGPHSLHRVNVLTGSAAFVRVGGETIPAPEDRFLTRDIWSPGRSREAAQTTVTCLTKDQRAWDPDLRDDIVDCGEPVEPTLITNGIDTSGIDAQTTTGRRIHERIRALREHLAADLPARDLRDTLLVGTWNIRNLGGGGPQRFGARMEESLYYIAEIISHFDIVAIQEARSDTKPIRDLLDKLGPSFDAIYSMVHMGPTRTRERLAFVFDKRKVRLGPVIASVVTDAIQYSRIPYVATFDVAGQRVTFCTVHMYYGAQAGERRARRIQEIEGLAKFLKLTKEIETEWDGPLILLGDMNAPSATSEEIEVLKEAGFYLDPDLAALPSNFMQTRTYDQIALLGEGDGFRTARVGVFDFFQDVFTEADESVYRAELGRDYLVGRDGETKDDAARNRYYRMWKTAQMSDHLVKWAEYRLQPGSD